jgi:hypothetical protein
MHLIDDALLAAESAVPAFDEFEDDTYGEPGDDAFEAIGGLHGESGEHEVRQVLARVFGM